MGALPPKSRSTFKKATEGVFVHYTAAAHDRAVIHRDCPKRVRNVQEFHQQRRGWSDIGYSFLVCHHGTVYEGRGFGVVGAHTLGYNSCSHAVCFLGADRQGRDDLTDTGREALGRIVRELFRRYPEGRLVRGHRDVNATACPGDEIYAWIGTKGYLDGDSPGDNTMGWKGFWRWLAWTLGEGVYAEVGPRHLPSRPDVPDKVPDHWWKRREEFVRRRTHG